MIYPESKVDRTNFWLMLINTFLCALFIFAGYYGPAAVCGVAVSLGILVVYVLPDKTIYIIGEGSGEYATVIEFKRFPSARAKAS